MQVECIIRVPLTPLAIYNFDEIIHFIQVVSPLSLLKVSIRMLEHSISSLYKISQALV
jgi:hypothetical protein